MSDELRSEPPLSLSPATEPHLGGAARLSTSASPRKQPATSFQMRFVCTSGHAGQHLLLGGVSASLPIRDREVTAHRGSREQHRRPPQSAVVFSVFELRHCTSFTSLCHPAPSPRGPAVAAASRSLTNLDSLKAQLLREAVAFLACKQLRSLASQASAPTSSAAVMDKTAASTSSAVLAGGCVILHPWQTRQSSNYLWQGETVCASSTVSVVAHACTV